MTPPPAMITGIFEEAIRPVAFFRSDRSGRDLGMLQVFFSNRWAGKSKASACTSWGMARVTAPVSAGEVSMRMALGRAAINCSGLLIRSQYLLTGLKQSLTEMSLEQEDSSCCNTGSTWR